jgi:hypothetical protein
MTPVALGARASGSPHPAGKPAKHPVVQDGAVIAFPGSGGFFVLDPSSGGSGWQTWWQGQLGPYNLTTRFWLVAGANWICSPPASPDWNRFDVAIYLLVNGAYGGDLNGQTFHQNADSMPGGGYYTGWQGNSIEARFFCEANTAYHARFLAQGGGSGNVYYRSKEHLNMWAYTVGEGVY